MGKAARIISDIIYVIGLALLALLLFTITVYRVNINFGQELVNINHNHLSFYALLVIGIILFFILAVPAKNLIDRVSKGRLFLILSIIFTVAGLYIIFNTEMTLRNDPVYCFSAAKDFNRGDYRSLLYYNYLGYDSHQLGLVTFERLICLFSESTVFFQLVNLLLSVLNNFFTYKITELVFGERERVTKYAILLSFPFLPQLFFIMYIYGNIPGLTFLMAAVFVGLRLLRGRGKSIVNSLLCVACMTCSVLIRSNYMIGAIAFAICALVVFLEQGKWRRALLVMIVAVAVLTLPARALRLYYTQISGIEVSRGTPMILYVAMGLQEGPMGNGWYNAFNNNTYEDSDYNYDEAARIGREEIRDRLSVFAGNPTYAWSFFRDKYISSWADPTYQTINSAPAITLENWDDRVRGDLLNNIYSGKKLYSIIATCCNVVNFIIVGAALLMFILIFRKSEYGALKSISLVFLLYPIGGMLFHLFWEAKARYMSSYIYFLIPVAAAGLCRAAEFIRGRLKRDA